MNRINVNVNEKQSISDIFTLTNVVTHESVSLIPSDSNGNFSWTGITKAPIVRNAMQTSTTSSEWSDLEYPYMAVQQEDWTGGRANLRFTTDKSRFFDSRRAQTAFNSCIYNAPLDHYSTGFKTAYSNCPQSLSWTKMTGSNKYLSRQIQLTAGYACGNVYIHLRRRGTPASGLTVRLVSDMTDEPTVYAEHTYTTAEVTDTTAEFFKFSFTAVSLPATVYLIVGCPDYDNENYWEVGTSLVSENKTQHSNDGVIWSTYQRELLYRLDTVQDDKQTKFFMYKQVMFMVRQSQNSTPRLYINGYIGQATDGGSVYVTRASAGWTANQWAGARVGIISRTGSDGMKSNWRTITENTNERLYIDHRWDSTYPDNGSEFVIVDTPTWTEITGHGLTAAVTDIHVIRDVVYFAQGDYIDVRKMRWDNGGYEWQTLTGVKATFLASVRDQNGMMMYRGRNDGINHKRTVERSRLLDWRSSEATWTKVTSSITTKRPVDKTVSNSVTTITHEPHPEKTVSDSTTATTTLGGQTEQIVTTTTDGGTTTKTVDNRKVASPSSETIDTTTTTTIDGVSVTNTESVSNSTSVTVSIVGNDKTTTTTESSTTTSHSEAEPALRTCIVTESKDFGAADYDAQQYVITIDNFDADNYDGECVVTLQESEDNSAFHDVQSVTATGAGIWRITAHCKMPYRRFMLTAVGTNCEVNNISISTDSILHFVDPVFLLDNYGKITRIFEYGSEQEKSLWIFQEGMVSSINKTEGTVDTYNLDRINLDELQVTAEEWNGSAVATADVYLMWSWLNGLQRHYNTQLEGKGPDHDEGMPVDMQGRITQILAYPGSFFVSIDAGENGYSSVMMFNGNGWHNLYRAPNKGEHIMDIGFQPIYGTSPDRLWMQVGDNVVWLSMPSKILYALQDSKAEYTHESVVVSSWITGGMAEVDKLWQSLSIMADNLDGETCWIEADYQLDDEEQWHPIPTNPYYISPQQEENFAADDESVNGKKLRYRLRMQTTDMHKTPKVNVVLIKVIGRVDLKYSYAFHFRNMKYKADLTGEYEELEPYELDEILSDWANKLYTLRLNSAYKLFDDKRVFLDGVQTSVVYEKGEGYLSQITLTEI